MASLNKCFFIGNLTRDPEIKYTPKGTAVAEIGIAVNKVWKDEGGTKHEDVCFLDLVAWGKTAEIAGQYLKKGGLAHFECEAKLDQWEDKQTQQKRSKVKFTVQQLTLLGSKPSESREEEPPPQHRRPPQKQMPRKPVDPDLDPEDSPFGA